MERKTWAKFVSLRASYRIIRRTRVPNLGRWIIYSESTKNSYRIFKITNTKEEQNNVYPWQCSQTKSSSIPPQSVCAHLRYFAHRIYSSTLWPSEKRPVQNIHSASCSPSVESSAKGTVRSVSKSDSVSDGGLKILSYWFRSEAPRSWDWRPSGVVTEISWWRRRKFFNHFLPVFSFLVQNCFLIPFLAANW